MVLQELIGPALPDLIGAAAGTLTTAAFVPQVLKTWRAKSAKDLSLGTFSLFSLGVLLWLTYGLWTRDLAVTVSNALTLLLALAMLVMKIRFK